MLGRKASMWRQFASHMTPSQACLTPSWSLCKPKKVDVLSNFDTRPKTQNPILLGLKYKVQNQLYFTQNT